MNAYAYQALEGPKYIRLIVLHPALSKTTPLRIDFVSSKLEDVEGDYDAVSYTWGNPILTFPLHVGEDGMQVHVTENLDRALRYLRYATRDRLLWADAACINQKDDEEKAIQIPLMVKIFRGARRVVAWLDPGGGGDTTVEQRGMRMLDRLSRLSNTQTNECYKDFSTVLRFLRLPWFNRLWIVQEVVFNIEVCLICDETELPFSRLIPALSVMGRQGSRNEPGDKAKVAAILEIGRLWNLYSLHREDSTGGDFNIIHQTGILHLMEEFGSYECTDPRDRIFALCSMANDVIPIGDSEEADGTYPKYLSTSTEDDHLGETDESSPTPTVADKDLLNRGPHEIHINIDYSLDVRETYEAFALACLMDAKTADLIWNALFMRQHSLPPINWPSWIPDWRIPPQKIGHGGWRDGYDYDSRKIAPGILRVSVPVTRYILDEKEKQLYTVNFKISKETQGSQMSFDSQLSQLYQMLQISENVQDHHQFRDETVSTSQKLDLIPNVLVHAIDKLLLPYNPDGSHRDVAVYWNLEQYLAKKSKELHAQPSSEPFSDHSGRLIEELAHSLAGGNTLFSFRDPGTGVNSVGYGSIALEIGDSLLTLWNVRRTLIKSSLVEDHVLILRPVYTTEVSDNENQIYRIVGHAYIVDPTAVLVGLEKKRRYKESRRADQDEEYRKSYLEMKEEEEEILSFLDCQTFDQVVYLA